MWETILATVVVSAVTALMGIVGKVVADWSAREKERAKADLESDARYDAIDALESGIITVGKTIVGNLKAAAEDGKLTKGEIKDVQNIAIEEAITIATNPKAIEFLATTAFNTLAAIITSIVQGKKKGE